MTHYPTIAAEFAKAKATKGDIEEHIQRLYELALACNHITEMGVRYPTSTWAFILGCACRGGTVISYDVSYLPEVQRAEKICSVAGVPWKFVAADVLHVEIEPTDMLFIDTWHHATQLREEFRLHAEKAKRWIVLHDTVSYGASGEHGHPGLWVAIGELLAGGEWVVKEHRSNENGLTTLERILRIEPGKGIMRTA